MELHVFTFIYTHTHTGTQTQTASSHISKLVEQRLRVQRRQIMKRILI